MHTHEAPDAASQRGATAVEYALLVSLIAGAIVGVVLLFGQDVLGLFGSVDFTP